MAMTEKPKKAVTRKSVTKKAPAKRKAAPSKRTPSTTTTQKRELIKRKKKLKLSVEELSLLEYNPTKTTWKCACGLYNSGKTVKCWSCALPKTKNLLWPIYVEACAKVGIKEGGQWKIVDKNRDLAKIRKNGKWEVIELPEGYTL